MIWIAVAGLWIFCGLVGGVIADNRKTSVGLGFFLGLCFGPIGLIITALLSPSNGAHEQSASSTLLIRPPTNDLNNDAYKLYLANAYSIHKNDTFDSFVCDSKLFKTIGEALYHAHSLQLTQDRAGPSNDAVARTETETEVSSVSIGEVMGLIATAVAAIFLMYYLAR